MRQRRGAARESIVDEARLEADHSLLTDMGAEALTDHGLLNAADNECIDCLIEIGVGRFSNRYVPLRAVHH